MAKPRKRKLVKDTNRQLSNGVLLKYNAGILYDVAEIDLIPARRKELRAFESKWKDCKIKDADYYRGKCHELV